MSYEPTNWKTGDVVTSAKLNKLENAVANSAGGNLVVHVNTNDDKLAVLDKTWQEIYDAYVGGNNVCIINEVSEDGMTGPTWAQLEYICTDTINDQYKVNFGSTIYSTQTPNGYPISRAGR